MCHPYHDCNWHRSLLSSRSFLGGSENFYEETWNIKTDPYLYITLYFETFDVGCETGSRFEIEFTYNTKNRYCNMDKPLVGIASYLNQLTIRFRLNRLTDSFLIEEFSGVYEVQSMNSSASTIPFTENNGKLQT